MKKIFMFLLCISVLAACNNNPLTGKKSKLETKDRDRDKDDEDEDYKKDKNKYKDDDDDGGYTKKDKYKDDEDEDDRSSNGWTSQTREKYIDECVSEAKKNVSRSKAESYCECMQEKIEKKYEMTYAEANKITEADLSTPEAQADIQECLQ